LLRFISWNANHDFGHSGLDPSTKKELVKKLIENGYKVFISSETKITDPFFSDYLIKISPELIHSVLESTELLVTEGATMASECAMLGTPAIYVNSLDAGTLREQEDRYDLIHGFRSSKGVIEKVLEIINTPEIKQIYMLKRNNMLSEKIDPTTFLIWFMENYPISFKILKNNPEYQTRFR